MLAVAPWSGVSGPSALVRAFSGEALFWPLIAASLATLAFVGAGARTRGRPCAAALAVAWGLGSGFAAGTSGAAFGVGAALALVALTVCFARAIARRGVFGGDPTVATIVVVIAALLLLFIFYPVGKSLLVRRARHEGQFRARRSPPSACSPPTSGRSTASAAARAAASRSIRRCSPSIVGVLSTLLGLVLALVVQRGGQRFSGLLKVMSILPIITPPFVIALALVVLFGRTGLITGWLSAGSAFRARAGSTACPA